MSTLAPSRSQVEDLSEKKAVDWAFRSVGLVAIAISVIAYIYFYRQGVSIVYKDAISHLQIAGRVVESPTAGFAQLGGVWLPLPHLLTLPLAWIDALYYSGFAGTIISMISFVVASLYIYKIVLALTKTRIAAITGVLVFALNPNVLYMQSTPMTELLLFAAIAAMVYYVQRWIQTEQYHYLFAAGLAAVFGCLTRYEAWVVTLALSIIVAVVAFKRYGHKRAEGTVLGFAFLGWSAIIGWAGWNWLILGNPLNFQTGEYSKPALWVGSDEPSLGNWKVAAQTYWYAVAENLGLVIILLAVSGIVALLLCRNSDILPVLSLGIMIPFFVFALEQGQRPLHVMQISGDLYNVRFGLLMVLLASIAIGYLASAVRWKAFALVTMAVAVVSTIMMVIPGGIDKIVTVREPVAYIEKGSNVPLTPTSDFLRENYHGGRILMESFGNETILFDARVSLKENVYEGSYKLWELALADPAENDVQWIVMRYGNSPDKVYQTLHNSAELNSYRLVFENDTYFVYERS